MLTVLTAFLTTLRSNLHLSTCPYDSPYSSLVSTPTSSAFSSTALLAYPTPSPLSISTTAAQVAAYHVPESKPLPTLTTSIAPSSAVNERSEALRLIGDSVAQQRQRAAKALVLHPYSVTTLVLLTGILARWCTLQALFAISTSLIVVVLAAMYWVTRDYAACAAKIDSNWLEGPLKALGDNGNAISNGMKKAFKCDEPIVVVSRWCEEIIGALVLRVTKRDRKGYLRAWTVDSSHRGKGVGSGLLQEGVRVAWGKGARAMELEAGHANSHRVLPQTFNRSFDEQEARTGLLLTDLVAQHRRDKSSR